MGTSLLIPFHCWKMARLSIVFPLPTQRISLPLSRGRNTTYAITFVRILPTSPPTNHAVPRARSVLRNLASRTRARTTATRVMVPRAAERNVAVLRYRNSAPDCLLSLHSSKYSQVVHGPAIIQFTLPRKSNNHATPLLTFSRAIYMFQN